jgi:hypothetical protein
VLGEEHAAELLKAGGRVVEDVKDRDAFADGGPHGGIVVVDRPVERVRSLEVVLVPQHGGENDNSRVGYMDAREQHGTRGDRASGMGMWR